MLRNKTIIKTSLAALLFGAVCVVVFLLARPQTQTDQLKIVSTIFPGYDFARTIAGDNADITMLIYPGSEIHSFEPSPQDIINIQDSDVFIYVGGESEAWVEKIIANLDTNRTKIVRMMDAVDLVEEELVEGMESEHQHEHEDEDEHESEVEYDEHVWTSPLNAIKIVGSIRDALVNADPQNANYYQTATANYTEQLTKLDSDIRTTLSDTAHHTLIFGDRFPLRYFVEEYGLQYYAAFPGCSDQTEASTATLAFLINKIKSENIKYIFTIELSNQAVARTIAAETGAEILEFHSLHNISKSDFDSGKTYLQIMHQNLTNLKRALN